MKEWNSVRRRAIFDCCKWDAQSEDHSVLANFPLVIDEQEWKMLARWSEQLAAEALAAEQELLRRPALHAKLGLSQTLIQAFRKNTATSGPSGCARVMRFDFHLTTDGWRISEVNSDVPGGFIESSGFTVLVAEHYSRFAAPPNAAEAYADAIAAAADETGVIALVHATAHSDDAQVMHYLAQELRRKNLQPMVIGPSHLTWKSGVARISCSFAEAEPSVLLRFLPAEWLPSLRPNATWEPWFCGGKTAMSNPGSAVLVQSKRFPIVWDELDTKLSTWRTLLPETKCPGKLPGLSEDWVLKPVLGRVGQDIGIDGVTEPRALKQIINAAKRHPTEWVAQRRFQTLPLQTAVGDREACLGMYTVDGRTAGTYGRIATKPLIDHDAQDIAVLLRGRNDANGTRVV
jgi:glutathionylspermidine synthase